MYYFIILPDLEDDRWGSMITPAELRTPVRVPLITKMNENYNYDLKELRDHNKIFIYSSMPYFLKINWVLLNIVKF